MKPIKAFLIKGLIRIAKIGKHCKLLNLILMKTIKTVLVTLLMAVSFNGFGQIDAITQFFDKYINDENFTVVYISPKMMEMIATIAEDDPEADEINEVLTGIEGIRILTTEVNTLMYYEEALKTLQLNKYELLMQVRDQDENVRFLVRDDGPRVKELLLLVGGNDNFVLLSFVGDIDLKKISKLGKSMEIEGLEHLEELEDE